MADPKDYRTESGHAPGEHTPDGIGVLHAKLTRHKERKLSDGRYIHGAAHHAEAAEQVPSDEGES